MSGLSDDFAKVQLQAALATKDLQEPRLGAYPRDLSSFQDGHTSHPQISDHAHEIANSPPLTPSKTEYRTVTAVSGPLVILDKVKVRRRRVNLAYKPTNTPNVANPRWKQSQI